MSERSFTFRPANKPEMPKNPETFSVEAAVQLITETSAKMPLYTGDSEQYNQNEAAIRAFWEPENIRRVLEAQGLFPSTAEDVAALASALGEQAAFRMYYNVDPKGFVHNLEELQGYIEDDAARNTVDGFVPDANDHIRGFQNTFLKAWDQKIGSHMSESLDANNK